MGENQGINYLSIAIGLVLFCGLIAAIFFVVNKGKATFSEGTDTLNATLDSMDTSVYSIYANTKQKGSDVIRIIDQSYRDGSVEVVVNTADGKYYRYSAEQIVQDDATLTGEPARYNVTAEGAGTPDDTKEPTLEDAVTASLATNNGYNYSADINTPGYISSNASFYCTAQKDVNGDVRRLTFVQEK